MGGGEGTPWQVCPLYSTAGPIKTQKGNEKVSRITDYLLDDLKYPANRPSCVSSGKNWRPLALSISVPARRLTLM